MRMCGFGRAQPADVVGENYICGNWLGQMALNQLKERDVCLKTLTSLQSISQEQKNVAVSVLTVSI